MNWIGERMRNEAEQRGEKEVKSAVVQGDGETGGGWEREIKRD